jgi:TIR domain/YEATS family
MSLEIRQAASSADNERWDWSVWIDGPDADLDQVESVKWVLHSTFPDPVVVVRQRQSKFQIDRNGWGEFVINAYVAANGGEQHLRHRLRLTESGGGSAQPTTMRPRPLEQQADFDVFLCHNAADKPTVRRIAERLWERDLRPWLDEDEVPPGRSFQEELERQINNIRSAAVFIGPNGIGPWQNQEVKAFLREFVERQCPVIPVLLPGGATLTLPVFLRGMIWVDLRTQDQAQIERLIWGITGRKPRPSH